MPKLNYFWQFSILILVISMTLVSCQMVDSPKQIDAAKPNIIWLVIDDAGYSDFGFFGSEIPTPHLDTLANNGVKFTDFHTAPSCSPTRSELLTGLDHHQAGFAIMAEDLTPDLAGKPGYEGYLNERTLPIAELLRDHGYHTYMTGKWHLGRGEHDPSKSGFEETFTLINGFGGHFGDQPGMFSQVTGVPIHQTYTYNGFEIKLPTDFYSSDFYTDQMIEFIESNRDDGKPFFAYLAYTTPHDPLQAQEAWIEKFEDSYHEGYEAVHAARINTMKSLGIIPNDVLAAPLFDEITPWDQLSEDERDRKVRAMQVYAAMLAKLDHNVGRLIAYLEETGELDNTWIFAFSDNGPNGEGQNAYWSEKFLNYTYDNSAENIGNKDSFYLYGGGWGWVSAAPLRQYKAWAAEGGIRTPMFIYGPGLKRIGETSHVFAEVTDLYPTALELAGIDFPETYHGQKKLPLIGTSMLPYITGEAETIHTDEAVFGWELWGRASIRKGDWKILWLPKPEGTCEWQLYNLTTDWGETTDLAAEAEYQDKLTEMVAEWENYYQANGILGTLGQAPWETAPKC